MFVIYVSPLLRDDIDLFVQAAMRIPTVRLALITQDSLHKLTAATVNALSGGRNAIYLSSQRHARPSERSPYADLGAPG